MRNHRLRCARSWLALPASILCLYCSFPDYSFIPDDDFYGALAGTDAGANNRGEDGGGGAGADAVLPRPPKGGAPTRGGAGSPGGTLPSPFAGTSPGGTPGGGLSFGGTTSGGTPPSPSGGTNVEGGSGGGLSIGGTASGGDTTGGAALAGVPIAGVPIAGAGGPAVSEGVTLIISEYATNGNDKALEFTNLGETALDLSQCILERYVNGETEVFRNPLELSGTLNPSESTVYCYSRATYTASCNTTNDYISHNGNDAYLLLCRPCDDGECSLLVMDSFGQIGYPDNWVSEGVSTVDTVLRRRCSVLAGDVNAYDPFSPHLEWEQFARDDSSGFGEHCN